MQKPHEYEYRLYWRMMHSLYYAGRDDVGWAGMEEMIVSGPRTRDGFTGVTVIFTAQPKTQCNSLFVSCIKSHVLPSIYYLTTLS